MKNFIITKSELKKIFKFGVNSSLMLLCPYLVILFNFKSLLDNLKDERNKYKKHKKEILNLIEYIDSKNIDFNSFSERQLKLINDLVKCFFQSVDDEKIDFIIAYLKGVLSDNNDNISKYPIEPITRIVRDISINELNFLRKYSHKDSKFIISSEKLSKEEFGEDSENHLESLKQDNILILFESDEFNTFTGLINLGLVYCLEMYSSSYFYTETGKNFVECLIELKELNSNNKKES